QHVRQIEEERALPDPEDERRERERDRPCRELSRPACDGVAHQRRGERGGEEAEVLRAAKRAVDEREGGEPLRLTDLVRVAGWRALNGEEPRVVHEERECGDGGRRGGGGEAPRWGALVPEQDRERRRGWKKD